MHCRILLTLLAAAASLSAQAPELGQGYLPEFNLAARQTLQQPKRSLPTSTPGGPRLVFVRSAKF